MSGSGCLTTVDSIVNYHEIDVIAGATISGVLDNTNTGTVTNDGTFVDGGSTNDGLIINNGDFRELGSFANNGDGTFKNYGTLDVSAADAVFANYGTLNDYHSQGSSILGAISGNPSNEL